MLYYLWTALWKYMGWGTAFEMLFRKETVAITRYHTHSETALHTELADNATKVSELLTWLAEDRLELLIVLVSEPSAGDLCLYLNRGPRFGMNEMASKHKDAKIRSAGENLLSKTCPKLVYKTGGQP